MAFLDKLSSFAQNTVDKTSDIIETKKLNMAISTEKAKIAELISKIGEYYWQQYSSGVTLDTEPTQFCEEIQVHKEKITSLETEIQAKKEEAGQASHAASIANSGEISCPACGINNPITSKFCKNCGGKLEINQSVHCECGHENAPGTKFCSACGKKLEA